MLNRLITPSALLMALGIFSGCEAQSEAMDDEPTAPERIRIIQPDAGGVMSEVPFIPQQSNSNSDPAHESRPGGAGRDDSPLPVPDSPPMGPAAGTEGDEPATPLAPPMDEDSPLEPPVSADGVECLDSLDCPDEQVCSVIYGDCIISGDDGLCRGVCIAPDDESGDWPGEGPGPEDHCVDHPEDCDEGPAGPIPADEPNDDEPPPGCGEGEDPCEAQFEACMEAVELAGAVPGGIDEDWCLTELAECQAEGLDQADFCPGDEEMDIEEMCQAQLDVCLAGLDENNEEDREAIMFCYEDVELCKEAAVDAIPEGEEPPAEPCEAEYQSCLDDNDPGPDASDDEIDRAFELCDAVFDACIDEAAADEAD